MKALLSVSDKTGITDFARGLVDLGFTVISTGGTYKELTKAGIAVTEISEITGFPECLDGRLKTLHPKIHGGILGLRDNDEHVKEMQALELEAISIVAVNLYPFKATIQRDATIAEAVENIDIGGPTMLRSAAKNYRFVSAVCDPADYNAVLLELNKNGKISQETNFKLSAKVFTHTAAYDALISSYLRPIAGLPEYPDELTITYEKVQEMRYGENPHQSAAFYREIGKFSGTLANIEQLHGKELSFNNINDAHGALELLKEYTKPAFVAVKHSNPCGVGEADDIYQAYVKAYTSDPVSIFGGILAANREIDKATAEEINKIFVEIVMAPGYTQDALDILKQKKNVRVIKLDNCEKSRQDTIDLKKVSGGLLVQSADTALLPDNLKTVTARKPTDNELADLLFTWKIVKYVKSNGIAIGKNGQSLGIGCGQVNRIWATSQAIEHCAETLGDEILKGAALASDAFFPFSDCVEEAHKAGITAIIQPGGSMKDNESIDLCDKYGIAMVFTDMRHFRH